MRFLNLIKAAVGAFGICAVAQTARADFSGPYAPTNWTFAANGGDGTVDTTSAPVSITITGNNNGNQTPTNTDYFITAVTSGTWSFDWDYSSPDIGLFDGAVYRINGAFFLLADNDTQGSGTVNIAVNAGDIIGFQVASSDGQFGAGVLEISNFSAPVPTPSVLALLGMSAVVGSRRRR